MLSKHEKKFLDIASKLDALTESCGEITGYAKDALDIKNDNAIKKILKVISDIASEPNYPKEIKQVSKALKDSLMEYCGYCYIKRICNSFPKDQDDEKNLEELLSELDELVGLAKVKQKVNDLMAYQTVQQLRNKRGFVSVKNTLHMAFTGNPGTGKTTVARIVGRLYKQLGLLSKGHFIEVSRTDLIAGYQGQTALKVKEVVEQAKGGVLFIDEAYSITENDHSDSYGRECLTELTKALEDYRDDLVVIVAGYTEPMNLFFQSNPGLKSRFNTFIEFEDYQPNELCEILLRICKKNNYQVDEKLRSKVFSYFEELTQKEKVNFANGRIARNLYDDLVMNHAKRVVRLNDPSDYDLSTLLTEDFREL